MAIAVADIDERMQENKQWFLDFIDENEKYQTEIANLISRAGEDNQCRTCRLIVNLDDLRNQDPTKERQLRKFPLEFAAAFQQAFEEYAKRAHDKARQLVDQEYAIGYEGPFGFHSVTPRELLSPLLSSLVAVEGIVTRVSLVRPKVVKSVHYCKETTEFHVREYRDITSLSGLPTGSMYPKRDNDNNVLVTEFGLSRYRDHQTLMIQEMPESVPTGQLPRSVDVIVENDLVDICKPGDRVQIVGVYRAVASKASGQTSGSFKTLIIASSVRQTARDITVPSFTDQDLKAIRTLSKRKNVVKVLGESLAPSICGHKHVKESLILMLLGGIEKNLPNGTHLRGDINMLMVGDPSVAKSQLLRSVMGVAPLAISTTGRGSTGVGLTAAVTTDQETGEKHLEAGAMVLADRGVVCIDEFDKMSDIDRVAIHEVMEQQTVTIAKAGMHMSLNARCSVVAAANPIYGSYDPTRTAPENIALPDSLLSRFDLMFIMLDKMDSSLDRMISNHVLSMHRTCPFDGVDEEGHQTRGPAEDDLEDVDSDSENAEDATLNIVQRYLTNTTGNELSAKGLPQPFIRKYIAYAKERISPKLSDGAVAYIAEEYAELRQNADRIALPMTARTLETIIRLSTAHAKARLSKTVDKRDAREALNLLQYALYDKDNQDTYEIKPKRKRGRKEVEREVQEEESEDEDNNEAQAEQRPRRARQSRTADVSGDKGSRDEGLTKSQALETTAGPAIPSAPPSTTMVPDENEDGSIAVDAHRQIILRTCISEFFLENRVEDATIDEILEGVNEKLAQQQQESAIYGELLTVLKAMDNESKIMIDGSRIILI